MSDYVIAINAEPAHCFDFLKEGETEQAALERAREYYCNDHELYKEYAKRYPDRAEYWEGRRAATWKILMKDFTIMTFDNYLEWQKTELTSGTLKEIDKETFENMLDVLPPLHFCTIGNVEMFCMREMYTGTITSQYAYNLVDGKYYTKMVDVTDRETWINKCFM